MIYFPFFLFSPVLDSTAELELWFLRVGVWTAWRNDDKGILGGQSRCLGSGSTDFFLGGGGGGVGGGSFIDVTCSA